MPTLIPIYDNDGAPVRSTCSIENTKGTWWVTIESRGGTLGTPGERNAGYAKGFELVFGRLASLGGTIEDALIVSTALIDRGLSEEERRLPGLYPVALSTATLDDAVKRFRTTQADVGTERTHGGGNTTRRIQFRVSLASHSGGNQDVRDFLTGARALGAISDGDLESSAADLETQGAFDPNAIASARQRTLATIAARLGQPKFRQKLLAAYDECCAVSGCNAAAVLEAAHIVPYRGQDTHHVQNGLLLRSDLHTLFDRGLLGVDPDTYNIVLDDSLKATEYWQLAGKPIRLPLLASHWPSAKALAAHLAASGLATQPQMRG